METGEIRNPEERTRLIVREIMDGGVSQSRIALEAGMSTSMLSQWLKGDYQGDNTAAETKVQTWLSNRADKARLGARKDIGFIETPTAKKIISALSYAQTMHDLVLVYGAAGVGKTHSLKHYREMRPNVWIVTMSPDAGTFSAALEEIAYELNLRGLQGRSSARLKRDIAVRIEGTEGLLICDESQHLSVSALECIRSLHDATGIGLALVGNETVYARVTGGIRSAAFAQLFSRIGKRLHLTRPLKGDVEGVIDAWGLDGREERELLANIAATPGALRSVIKTLRLAGLMADGDDAPVSLKYLRAAWRDLSGATQHTIGENS